MHTHTCTRTPALPLLMPAAALLRCCPGDSADLDDFGNFAYLDDFDDFDYLIDFDDFTVQVPRKSKLADQINDAALPLKFRNAQNCGSSMLRCHLDVETC
jgi:hypothetical protein